MADRQENAAAQSNYRHYAYQFLTENGVQDNAQLTLNFDPSYQTITLHQLRVHRRGKVIDKLTKQEIRLLQREEGLERQLYDGTMSAIAVIEDLRVGDILEYAYTREGRNPVFGENYSHVESLRWSAPLHQSRFRFVCERNRDFQLNTYDFKSPSDFPWKPIGKLKELTIYEDGLEALLGDGEVPSYYDEWPWIEFSDYQSWEEVATWATGLYDLDQKIPNTLKTEIQTFSKLESEEERILAALRWCQDEIRYLGMFEGIHSHQPYPLQTILRRRFGDCKDKSMVLTTILRELGFDAHLALVATGNRHKVKDWLPTPGSFNHLVVHLRYQDRDIWLDPTRSFQGGPLDEIYFPAYGYGLIVSPDTQHLTPIEPSGYDRSKLEVIETFNVEDYQGKATLSVLSIYRGGEADRMRSNFTSKSLDRWQKDYLNHYSKDFPEISAVSPPRFEDNETENVVKVWEEYEIQNIWIQNDDGEDGSMEIDFYARIIAAELETPSTRIRKSPFAISHPRNVVQKIILNLPTKATFNSAFTVIENPSFEMSLKEVAKENGFEATFSYRSLKNTVAAEDTPQYLKDLEESNNLMSYYVWVPKNYASKSIAEIRSELSAGEEASPYEYNWIIITIAGMGLFVGFIACLLIYFWDPKAPSLPENPDPKLVGLGGWLALITLGALFRPFGSGFLLYTSVKDWDAHTWQQVGDPSSDVYHVLWQPGAILEITSCSFFVVYEFLLLILLLARRTSFPRLMVVYYILWITSAFGLQFMWSHIDAFDAEILAEYKSNQIQALAASIIWIPYFFVSKRVRSTFVVRRSKVPVPAPPPELPAIA